MLVVFRGTNLRQFPESVKLLAGKDNSSYLKMGIFVAFLSTGCFFSMKKTTFAVILKEMRFI